MFISLCVFGGILTPYVSSLLTFVPYSRTCPVVMVLLSFELWTSGFVCFLGSTPTTQF